MEHVTEKQDHQTRVKQATEAGKAKQNPDASFRLGYHLMAPSGWINDPNGLVFYKEQYHVFYQHHPYDETWGPMHWGHAVSDDLVHWRHLPVALAPGDAFDQSGCFSGSAVDDDGVLTLIYTGHNVVNQKTDELYQNQNIARSVDGVTFEKSEANPVIPAQPVGMQRDFRDPKVWKEDGSWKMVVGSTEAGKGQVLLYQSSDLENWEYQAPLAKHNGGNEGYMWECPDFFKLDGKHVLLLSPQGIEPEGDRFHNLFQTGSLIGEMRDGEFVRGAFTELDYGHDFYAVQTFLDGKGRRIAIGWMDMWESPMPSQQEGWSGALTLPRELNLSPAGKLRMKPVEELKHLRVKEEQLEQNEISGTFLVDGQSNQLELEFDIDLSNSDADIFGVNVCCSSDGLEKTTILVNRSKWTITLDRSYSGIGVSGARTAPVELTDSLHVRLFIDRSSIEIFLNEGETVLTSRIYPKESSTGIEFFAEEGFMRLSSAHLYQLKNSWLTD
ncbi:LOW QUALITY PROTEIN: sucrose-6-phosphate hydrolase [Bacillus sp. JCM 19045]|nr:LOW QUALITY PROTEIN: sucrose-6-phosphate hydrolase [Bacillus sp. JCM 19045]